MKGLFYMGNEKEPLLDIEEYGKQMNILNCCLIFELGLSPIKKHESHEPELWEHLYFILKMEAAIIRHVGVSQARIWSRVWQIFIKGWKNSKQS